MPLLRLKQRGLAGNVHTSTVTPQRLIISCVNCVARIGSVQRPLIILTRIEKGRLQLSYYPHWYVFLPREGDLYCQTIMRLSLVASLPACPHLFYDQHPNPSRLSCHLLDAKIEDSLLVTCIQHDATEHSLLQSSSLWHSPRHIMMCPLWNSWPSSQPSHCIKNLFMLPSQHMQWHRQTQSLRFLPLLLPHWKRPILLHIHRVIHGIVPQHCSRLVVFSPLSPPWNPPAAVHCLSSEKSVG